MRVILRWSCSQSRPGCDIRLARFKRVLRAAQRTDWYPPLLEGAGLDTLEALAAVDSVEHTLHLLPAVDLHEFRRSPAAFQSPDGSRPVLQAFQSPLEHTPKTAILMAGFEQTSGVKVISKDRKKGMKQHAASALAGPVGVLRELADAIEKGCEDAPQLRHFVVPFTGGHLGELTEDDREKFWRVFRVPAFEQRVAFDGRVIACECEAHAGLHILQERATFEEVVNSDLLLTSLTDLRHPTLRVGTGVKGAIQQDCCDCGDASARLVPGPWAAIPAVG